MCYCDLLILFGAYWFSCFVVGCLVYALLWFFLCCGWAGCLLFAFGFAVFVVVDCGLWFSLVHLVYWLLFILGCVVGVADCYLIVLLLFV